MQLGEHSAGVLNAKSGVLYYSHCELVGRRPPVLGAPNDLLSTPLSEQGRPDILLMQGGCHAVACPRSGLVGGLDILLSDEWLPCCLAQNVVR